MLFFAKLNPHASLQIESWYAWKYLRLQYYHGQCECHCILLWAMHVLVCTLIILMIFTGFIQEPQSLSKVDNVSVCNGGLMISCFSPCNNSLFVSTVGRVCIIDTKVCQWSHSILLIINAHLPPSLFLFVLYSFCSFTISSSILLRLDCVQRLILNSSVLMVHGQYCQLLTVIVAV